MDVADAVAGLVVGILALVGLLAVIGLVSEAGGTGIRRLLGRARGSARDDASFAADETPDEDAVALARHNASMLAETEEWFMASPDSLEANPLFEESVEALADEATPVQSVIELGRDTNGWAASMALAALARRDDVPEDWCEWAARNASRPSACEDAFQLRALAKHGRGSLIGQVVGRPDGIAPYYLAEFVRMRIEGGERVDVATFDGHLSALQAEETATFLDRFATEVGEDVRAAFDEWRALQVLGGLGRVWQRPFDRPPTLLIGRRRELVELVVAAMAERPRRSVLVVGEHGAGKTALIRAALDRVEGTTVFEATATQVQAGAIYIGELEGRVKQLADAMRERDTVWVLPELQEALFAGQHTRSPQGMLDALLPHVESGAITVVAEVTPTSLEVVRAARPRVTSAFDVLQLRSLEPSEAIAVARHSLDHDGLEATTEDDTLVRAFDLAQQFLPGVGAPGNLLRLVRATVAEAEERGHARFDAGDVLSTLAAASGLPLELLDADTALRLEDVRSFFEQRIVQQPEAVDCVVERIAMIKAGLTDPTRPLGVVLFLGPTGTGKTEIAKVLAEYLFGSPDRMVRLDMSEFQTPDSLERLLTDTAVEKRGAGLIAAVRGEPFSVVLLDEFEKAAEQVWDVFLQVFDDGRLTDSHGQLVDFRRCVIILTSNVGSAIAGGSGVGFAPGAATFSAAVADRALRTTFRPEFLNRLDRVVTFRPFDRSAMRSLLDKELGQMLARRGLRDRPWAVELDESAYAFLIDKGFSPTLGARPLRRAIEQHLLAPLAAAIVEQTVPAGDQFLFVSAPAGERIDVTFVDPDAGPAAPVPEAPASLELRALARAGQSDESSTRFVLAEARRIVDSVGGFDDVKAGALAALGEPTFWETQARFAVLAKVEYLDRLQAAALTAQRLAARLEKSVRPGNRASADLVELLAGRLHVLDSAVEGIRAEDPYELVVDVAAQGGDEGFGTRIAEMYVAWGERRGMHVERVVEEPSRQLLLVSGLGCWRILHHEAGLHVFEHAEGSADGARVSERDTVRVSIAALEPGARADGASAGEVARAAASTSTAPNVVVRRYRTGASPLVRDSVRAYRTGNVERVLAGEFDVF